MSRSSERRAGRLPAALALGAALFVGAMPAVAQTAVVTQTSVTQTPGARAAAAPARPATTTVTRPWADIGRPATPDEIRAWDIDVRADFKGLPPGSGSVAKGQDVWEAKCASCHGIFGESNEVFTPIVGGTTKDDVRTGRVANLLRPDYPQRTTLMKLSQISTLWDYINRAMPWNAPKSLSVEEVYAVVAYILHLGDIVPADFVLSDRNMAQVQQWLPNRNGKMVYRNLWEKNGRPDVNGVACLRDCATVMDVRSSLPEHARNAHGNLAEQNRIVGPFRGADTTRPAGENASRLASAASTRAAVAQVHVSKGSLLKPPADIAKDGACLACHSAERSLVGPAFKQIAARYQGDAKAEELLVIKVRNGGQGAWGSVPMPANTQLKDEDIRAVVRWILDGAR